MKTLAKLRAESNRCEEAAFMALRNYLCNELPFDQMERFIVAAFCANREVAAVEQLEHARQILGRQAVAELARACGVHLGPDIGPDGAPAVASNNTHPANS